MVYFDNAATSYPKPQEVIFAVGNALTDFGGNPGRSGHKMSLKAAQSVYRMREKAATFFGLEQSENVILTKKPVSVPMRFRYGLFVFIEKQT